MSVFDLEKIRKDLSVYDRDMPCAMKALQIMVQLCNKGRELEAENAELKRQLAAMGSMPRC